MASGGLTIKELNDLLDSLASAENRSVTFSSPCILCLFFVASELSYVKDLCLV